MVVITFKNNFTNSNDKTNIMNMTKKPRENFEAIQNIRLCSLVQDDNNEKIKEKEKYLDINATTAQKNKYTFFKFQHSDTARRQKK
jgi:hypothetical protein